MLGRLASGAEFDRTAQVYSEDSTRDNGGDWGWIERKTLAEPLEKFAFNMPVGRISNIIDYAGNYYILKVEDKQGGTTRSLNEARDDIEKKLLQEEAQRIQERWIAGLRAKGLHQDVLTARFSVGMALADAFSAHRNLVGQSATFRGSRASTLAALVLD